MVADLIRALLAAAAGAVLPGYFWAAVLRPTSGLGERLAYSTVVSMASVPTVAVILARVARTGVELWVALAAVLIVLGTGLLAFRLKGPAPGTAAPVLRMPDPTRDPRVLGLVAAALAVGLVLMAVRRPPAARLHAFLPRDLGRVGEHLAEESVRPEDVAFGPGRIPGPVAAHDEFFCHQCLPAPSLRRKDSPTIQCAPPER